MSCDDADADDDDDDDDILHYDCRLSSGARRTYNNNDLQCFKYDSV